jgi:hypothetical protein
MPTGEFSPWRSLRRCNNWTKAEFTNYLTGLLGDWAIIKTISREDLEQLSAENRNERQDTRGRIFHLWQQVRATT